MADLAVWYAPYIFLILTAMLGALAVEQVAKKIVVLAKHHAPKKPRKIEVKYIS